MSRLNKALERIKNQQPPGAKPPRGYSGDVVPTLRTSNVDDPIDDSIATVSLDSKHLTSNHVINPEIDPAVRTSYKMLRTRILQRMRANNWQSIAITSATQGDGKTLTAINLAISLAGDVNHNVCLVDLDLRHSSVAKYLGIKTRHGISDCLEGRQDLKSVLVRPNIDRLVVIPNYKMQVHSSELISSPTMRQVANELSSNPQRIMIYDMPPLLSADDVLAFQPVTDAVLLVVAERKTTRTDTMKAFELLESANVLGTILNRSDEKTAAYY